MEKVGKSNQFFSILFKPLGFVTAFVTVTAPIDVCHVTAILACGKSIYVGT